jgi:ribosome-associated protein
MANDPLVQGILDAAGEKKGEDVKVYDVAGVVDFADAIVIISGTSDRHVLALAEAIEVGLKKQGHPPVDVEGTEFGRWVVMDYGPVVVHVMLESLRDYYRLDELWDQAPEASRLEALRPPRRTP